MNARVAVVEVAEGDAGPGPGLFVDFVRRRGPAPAIGMALQVAANPIVVVARPVGKELRAGIEQQPGGLRGRGGNHDQVGRLHLQPVARRRNISHPGPGRGRRRGSRCTTDSVRTSQLPRGHRHGNHRVLRAVLGVDRAGEAHAMHACACRPAGRCRGPNCAAWVSGNGCQPSRLAAASTSRASLLYGKGGIGCGFLRGGAKGFWRSSPATPISHSAFS